VLGAGFVSIFVVYIKYCQLVISSGKVFIYCSIQYINVHLSKRIRGNKAYYYALEKTRVGDKVKTTKQIYLGTAKDIAEKLTSRTESLVRTKTFGSIALLLYIEKLYDLENVFNESLDKKRKNRVSGKYFLSIVLNRILKPKSKTGIDKWLKSTYLDWYWNLSTSSQKLWNHLEYLDDDTISVIEGKLAETTFKLTDNTDKEFLWDTSNYFTYMSNRKSSVIAKGKSKQGRHEKNLICHGLLAGKESRMPLRIFQFKYTHDSNIFKKKIKEVAGFLKAYKNKEFTLIADKGNNSEKNIKLLSKYKFIGSLRKEQAKDLLEIPLKDYQHEYRTRKNNEVRVYDAGKQQLYSSEYRVIISYEEQSKRKQEKTLEDNIKRTLTDYEQIKDKKYKKSISAANALKKILPRKYLKAFEKDLVQEGDGWMVKLSENSSERRIYERSFGKSVLFTNKFDSSPVKVVKSYRSLNIIEDQFKALHNAFMVPITPIYEWTDQKIKAHVFLCYVALVMVRALELVALQKGLSITFSKLLEEAEEIRVGLVKNGRSMNYCFERTTAPQQKIMNIFDMHEFFTF